MVLMLYFSHNFSRRSVPKVAPKTPRETSVADAGVPFLVLILKKKRKKDRGSTSVNLICVASTEGSRKNLKTALAKWEIHSREKEHWKEGGAFAHHPLMASISMP